MRKVLFASALGAALVVTGVALLLQGGAQTTVAANEEDAFPLLTATKVIEGKASWYGPGFDGRLTASGVPYNRRALTAAHRSLPAGTVVRVTNLRNGRATILVINDWGPVPADRVIDVSEAAAEVLGFRDQGLTPVRIEVYRAANNPL